MVVATKSGGVSHRAGGRVSDHAGDAAGRAADVKRYAELFILKSVFGIIDFCQLS